MVRGGNSPPLTSLLMHHSTLMVLLLIIDSSPSPFVPIPANTVATDVAVSSCILHTVASITDREMTLLTSRFAGTVMSPFVVCPLGLRETF